MNRGTLDNFTIPLAVAGRSQNNRNLSGLISRRDFYNEWPSSNARPLVNAGLDSAGRKCLSGLQTWSSEQLLRGSVVESR